MPSFSVLLTGYILIVNLLLLLMMGIDKYKARNHQWRIPELTLLGIGLAGGGAGGLLGMFLFHHKTRKLIFYIAYALGIVLCYYVSNKIS
ncbi:hypothetical protein D3C80_1211570 [compost metagenome]